MVKTFKGALELNWINKDKSLLYEIDEEEGMGIKPVWIEKSDIRVSEPRNLKLIEEYGDPNNDNMLIKGDNLLALKTLVEIFKNKEEKDKVKSIYIDPPFNTGAAFENYNDNLEHSQWLTMMRDRLILLKQLLREDGSIFVHIDYQEVGYLIPLMDEVFGRNNFVQLISIKASSAAGFKTVNPGPVDVTEYILFYTKKKSKFIFKRLFVPILYDSNYNLLIKNPHDKPDKWEFENIISAIYRKEKIPDWNNTQKAWRHAEKKWGRNWKIIRESLIADYALENAFRLVSKRDPHKPTKSLQEKLKESKDTPNRVLIFKRDKYEPLLLYNGGSLAFYKNKIKIVDGKETATELLTDFWNDISWAGIAREGSVKFKNGKKPEKLLKRIINLSSEPGDIILDSFLGSGTTAAVSQKMKRKWVGIEIGKHADSHCFPRLKNVADGKDSSGISKDEDIDRDIGGFRYYEVGESILSNNDMNWNLTYEEIARSLFMMYGYCFMGNLENGIYLGIQKEKYALSIASKDPEIINNEEMNDFINKLKDLYEDVLELVIYTNKGIGIKNEDLPKFIVIKKIPESVLSKYKL